MRSYREMFNESRELAGEWNATCRVAARGVLRASQMEIYLEPKESIYLICLVSPSGIEPETL